MSDLQDIGGGNKMLSVGSALGQAKDLLSLVDLANRIKKAPADQQIAEAQAKIQGQEASPEMLQIKAFKAAADLHSAVNTEARTQAEFAQKFLSTLPSVFGQLGYEGGQLHMANGIKAGVIPPGSIAVQNTTKDPKTGELRPDGTYGLMIQQSDGSALTLTLDPNRVGTAEQRQALEDKMRGAWSKVGEGLDHVTDAYRNFKSTVNLATGPSDVVMLHQALKMLDRTTQVGQGQTQESLALVQNMRSQINSWLERSKGTDSPVFGAADSPTRQAFIASMEKVNQNAMDAARVTGKFFYDATQNGGGNGKNVLIPYGGLGYKQIVEGAPLDNPITEARRAPKKTEAGEIVAETPATKPEGTPDFGGERTKAQTAGVPAELPKAAAKPTPEPTPAPKDFIEFLQQGLFQKPGAP